MKRLSAFSLFCCLLLFLCVVSSSSNAAEQLPTFSFTLDGFEKLINANAAKFSAPAWQRGELVNGEFASAQNFTISPYVAASARTPNSGKNVSDITLFLVLGEKATQTDSTAFLAGFGILVATVTPELSKEERRNLLAELGLSSQSLPKEQVVVQKGGVRFSYTAIPERKALVLTASPLK